MKTEFIPGIYNYCDHWCERCAFCGQCLSYAHANNLAAGENDITNKAFWSRLTRNFEKAARLLHRMATKYGIDLTVISREERAAYSRKQEKNMEAIEQHPLAIITLKYFNTGSAHFEDVQIIKNRAGEMLDLIRMGLLADRDADAGLKKIRECREIINWYLHFIHIKIRRALQDRLEDDEWEEVGGIPRDSDGSAKVALIGIDRSIEAWTNLIPLLPAAEDQIVSLLALLQKSRRMAEAEFPAARQFIRPGFDEA